ncbi:sensor domain-containing diguanylate cyclase, partial [Devosia sp.]|uniref:sensor domain-containing diguanylate cyclase n=1 Tax=Devosia sp. TaxID=1871048 RepID=UPI002FC74714
LAYPLRHPLTEVAGSNDDDFGARLARLCDLLGIAGAQLTTATDSGSAIIAAVGPAADNLALLQARALPGPHPLVLPDIAAAGPSGARFYVGLKLPSAAGGSPLLLSLFDPKPRAAHMAERIAGLAQELVTDATVEQLRQVIECQAKVIAESIQMEQLRRELFERASATAKIGVWQCDLADNSLLWTNGVYDLFEIERGTQVTRELSLSCYTEASRRQMEAARAHAIATCTDFALTVEIITVRGKRRWMRLTGAVESRNGVATRIFGMKQDVTEEKLMADRTRYLAEFDVMTGLANRSQFQAHLAGFDAQGGNGSGALLLVDLDGFKQVNDTYGHALGDECLKEAALRLTASCANAQLVARIGGDEFAVLLGPATPADAAEALAEGIVATIGQPFVRGGHTFKLGASVGVAHYRGGFSQDLFRQADTALYAAKDAGRNTSRTYRADAA